MRSLIDICDFSLEEIEELLHKSEDIRLHPERYAKACEGKKLATLFFEPSTRTRLSFEAAMLELGGSCLGFSVPSSSSAAKGESIADTARVVSHYADIIAMRHPAEGAPLAAAMHATVPVINAGDGGHFHPTQTLTDLVTIFRAKRRLANLTVGYCGDLKYGRTVHSLIYALSRYAGVKTILISPEELMLPDYVKNAVFMKNGQSFSECRRLEEALPDLDVLYMTRIQRERFEDPGDYERLKDCYRLTAQKLTAAKKDLAILHPLPRVGEIAPDVDADPRALYFQQVLNGKHVRMALILKLLFDHGPSTLPDRVVTAPEGLVCSNPRCITNSDPLLTPLFYRSQEENGVLRCRYCDKTSDKENT